MPKFGGAMAPPAPPGTTGLSFAQGVTWQEKDTFKVGSSLVHSLSHKTSPPIMVLPRRLIFCNKGETPKSSPLKVGVLFLNLSFSS